MTQILWLPHEQLPYLPEMAHVIAGTQAHLHARTLDEERPWQQRPDFAPAATPALQCAALLTAVPWSLTLIGSLVMLFGNAPA